MVIVDRENRYSEGTHKAVVVAVKSPSYGLIGPQYEEIEIPLDELTRLIREKSKMAPQRFDSYLATEALLSEEWRRAYREIDERLRLYSALLIPAGLTKEAETERVVEAILAGLRPSTLPISEIS